ncbi:hypothetical protein CBF45_06990 [Bordetella sp. J329]|jgi:TRAP-type C4-dicarboxylate transport system permease small subunit|uniref:TRAP transporter small permease n=1 Tax=Kerstersia gyiorum TaxID=206506 RepID=UPI000FDC7C80|nr:TRAP transporter small permease subunit [Kerstersia gyiorum]AZV93494.1 hypothetical protein CBF45_06990 [Bordetella sp. J329]MCH4273126.1 TRAP transporter small permease [Kerstersia gyiorum]MCI1228465.1 TRAP transporter small permease [Kerstersia gyiorum]
MSDLISRRTAGVACAWTRAVTYACKLFAVAGGILFVLEAMMSVVSVLGRLFFATPVPGDYELVQVMSAMGIAMCLPYCQIRRGHVFVDFFTLWASAGVVKVLNALAALALALVAFLLATRSYEGMVEMHDYGETSMVISLPVWWGYVPVAPSFVLLGLAALLTLVQDVRLPAPQAVHA